MKYSHTHPGSLLEGGQEGRWGGHRWKQEGGNLEKEARGICGSFMGGFYGKFSKPIWQTWW